MGLVVAPVLGRTLVDQAPHPEVLAGPVAALARPRAATRQAVSIPPARHRRDQ